MTTDSRDPSEIAKFEAMAAEWWDPKGKFKPLHMMNPIRLDYITRQVAAEFGRDLTAPAPFAGLRILDIGCGGGLVAEPMARLGARVTGIDPTTRNIEVAKLHAAQSGLSIDYRSVVAESLAEAGEKFDIVLCLEVVEHVPDVGQFVRVLRQLLAPGGLLIVSTLNRTLKSYALAIVGAEYILRWLPRGTHRWDRFVTPDELRGHIEATGLIQREIRGMVYNPLTDVWSLAQDTDVNYLVAAVELLTTEVFTGQHPPPRKVGDDKTHKR